VLVLHTVWRLTILLTVSGFDPLPLPPSRKIPKFITKRTLFVNEMDSIYHTFYLAVHIFYFIQFWFQVVPVVSARFCFRFWGIIWTLHNCPNSWCSCSCIAAFMSNFLMLGKLYALLIRLVRERLTDQHTLSNEDKTDSSFFIGTLNITKHSF